MTTRNYSYGTFSVIISLEGVSSVRVLYMRYSCYIKFSTLSNSKKCTFYELNIHILAQLYVVEQRIKV